MSHAQLEASGALPDELSRSFASHERAQEWLCCQVAGTSVAIPSAGILEIVRFRGVQPLPLLPLWLKGVMNLRGNPVLVLDLAHRLGLPSSSDAPTSRATLLIHQTAIQADSVDADSGGFLRLGLYVDRVQEMVPLQTQSHEAVPRLGHAVPARFVNHVTRWRGQPLLGLDMTQVLDVADLSQQLNQHVRQQVWAATR